MLFSQLLISSLSVTCLQLALSPSALSAARFQNQIAKARLERETSSLFRDLDIEGPHPEDPYNTICYGVLGCITVNEQRDLYLFPEPLEDIEPTVCLYTDQLQEECEPIDSHSLTRTVLAGSKDEDTYWITHGYGGSSTASWIKRLTYELLLHKTETKVFVIDWADGAETAYNQAVVNVELEAAYFAHIMRLHETHGLNISKIHFIGHSLGAHFGGFVGSWLTRHAGMKMGRISGLDPAQPLFQGYSPQVRLDPSDAETVDVIHTDAQPYWFYIGLGTQEPSGHVDFYPNGRHNQPGCQEDGQSELITEDDETSESRESPLGCDHMLAYEYFIESIGSRCHFKSFACSSWSEFVNSKCNIVCNQGQYETCNRMGFHARKPPILDQSQSLRHDRLKSKRSTPTPVLYFSITGSQAPYCREQYQITLNLGASSSKQHKQNLNIKVLGHKHHNVVTLHLGE